MEIMKELNEFIEARKRLVNAVAAIFPKLSYTEPKQKELGLALAYFATNATNIVDVYRKITQANEELEKQLAAKEEFQQCKTNGQFYRDDSFRNSYDPEYDAAIVGKDNKGEVTLLCECNEEAVDFLLDVLNG